MMTKKINGIDSAYTFKKDYQNFDKQEKIVFHLVIALIIFSLLINVGLATTNVIDIRGVEPGVVYTIQEVMVGDPLYPDPQSPPFSINQYTPFYYLLIAGIANLLRIVPGQNFLDVYLVGRVFSFAATIGIGLSVFFISRKFGANFLVSCIGVAAVLILPIPWFTLVRPDALMVFLGVLSIVLFIRYLIEKEQEKRFFLLILVGSVGFLSLLTKQNGTFFLMAIALFALLQKQFQELGYIIFGIIITLVISSLLFQNYYSLIPGESNYIYEHIVKGLNNGINFVGAYDQLYSIYLSWYFPLLALPVGGILIILRCIKKSGIQKADDISLLLAVAFIVLTTGNLVAGLKDGSAINYILDSAIIGVLLLIRLTVVIKQLMNYCITENPSTITYTRIFYYSFVLLFFSTLLINQTLVQRGNVYRSRLIRGGKTSIYQEIEDLSLAFKNEFSKYPNAWIFSNERMIDILFFDHVLFPQPEVAGPASNLVFNYTKLDRMMETGEMRFIIIRKGEELPWKLMGIDVFGFDLKFSTTAYDVYINTRAP
jgi:hypothetical protein